MDTNVLTTASFIVYAVMRTSLLLSTLLHQSVVERYLFIKILSN